MISKKIIQRLFKDNEVYSGSEVIQILEENGVIK